MDYSLHHGDCLEVLRTMESNSIDAVVTDPPYAEVKRSYGKMTECEWMSFMKTMTIQVMRIVKPSGSAMFILQPNSERLGKMRLWLWEYMLWAGKEWNIVQDVYWWNTCAMPGRFNGLMRPSLKYCIWLGSSDCYRNQDEVLWSASEKAKADALSNRALKKDRIVSPSGHSVNRSKITSTMQDRGGVTPYNVIPIPNSDSTSKNSAGAQGHGAGTPYRLAEWWIRYISPLNGNVLDTCMGVGTMGIAALKLGRNFIGIEKDETYFKIAEERIKITESHFEKQRNLK
jgi:DNA modification methylase